MVARHPLYRLHRLPSGPLAGTTARVPAVCPTTASRAPATIRGSKIASVHRTALFSRDRRYRYRLGRRWGDGAAVCFVLLNPSTADETREDPTVRRCIGFAGSLGYGALEVVNLYAYVATDPAELRRAGYPVGHSNDRHIEAVVTGVRARGPGVGRARCPAGAAGGGPGPASADGCETALPEAHGGRPPGAPAEAANGVRAGEIPGPSGKSGETGCPSPLTHGCQSHCRYVNLISA